MTSTRQMSVLTSVHSRTLTEHNKTCEFCPLVIQQILYIVSWVLSIL